jgi:DNA primase
LAQDDILSVSNTTEQIKDKLDIAEFIGQYVELKPAGSNFKGLCPFHQEKTPSFMVSSPKQMFKCFGCSKGGDIFTFLQEYEGIAFPEALRILADKAGVELPNFDARGQSRKSKLYDILKLAADFYHLTLLKSKSAQIARDYIKNRHIDDLACDNFKIGYSVPEWRSLFNFLKKKGVTKAEIVSAGLVKQSSGRLASSSSNYYDIFRDRLMFPIFDEYSRVVGFGGRILKDVKDQPKYINTPQTEIYDKSRVLYGLDKAKDSIRKEQLAVLVEGYMDVIASHRVGVKNVIAASGTALGENQLRLIGRFTNNIAMAFDDDKAGRAAAFRLIQTAESLGLGLNIKIIGLPQGADPDDLINQNKAKWQKIIKKNIFWLDYYFGIELKNLDTNNFESKKQARDKLLPMIFFVRDPIVREHFLEKLALLLKVRTEDLTQYREQAARQAPTRAVTKSEPTQSSKQKSPSNLKSVVEHVLALIFVYPKQVINHVKLPKLIFKPANSANAADKLAQENQKFNDLYKEVRNQYNKGEISFLIINAWQSKYQNLVDSLKLLADKDYSDLDSQAVKSEFNRLVKFLNYQILKIKRGHLIAEIKLAENKGDEALVLELSKKLDNLTNKKYA